jgi:hypothetical protein
MEEVKPDSIAADLVKSLLEEANDALLGNDLDEARTHLDRALGVEGEHPKRRSDIQEMLKAYCDRISDQSVPDWGCVHTALELLAGPNLVDGQTQTWQREFKLKEARFWLAHEDQAKAFDIFADLMNKTPGPGQARQISDMVRDLIAQRLAERPWPFLGEVVGRLHDIWPPDELHDWLETTSNILDAAAAQQKEQLRLAAAAQQEEQLHLAAATAQHEEQLRLAAAAHQEELLRLTTATQEEGKLHMAAAAQQEEQLRRYRNLSYALAVGIAAALVLAFALVLFA